MGTMIAPTTSGTVTYAWYNGRRAGRLNERASLTATDKYTLNNTLPARCRIMMTALKAVSAITLNSSTSTGTTAPESVAPCKSIPATNATASTLSDIVVAMIRGSTGTASNNAAISAAGTSDTSVVYSVPEQWSACKTSVGGSAVAGAGIGAGLYNTATSALTLYLIPCRGTGTENFNMLTTPTNGFHFGATGTLDVDVWFEQFTTNPTQ